MCGIVGYVGQGDASRVVVDGLRRLEYRGYDSAGLATVSDGRLAIRRRPGKIGELSDLLEREPAAGSIGLGHTRWATHGAPTELNAHPHVDCGGTLAVVHNGIIENYLPLKRSLAEAGHVFRSDTDTEVIAHLVHSNLLRIHVLTQYESYSLIRHLSRGWTFSAHLGQYCEVIPAASGEGRGWYQRRILIGPLLVVVCAMAWAMHEERGIMDLKEAVPLGLLGLFLMCMFFHGELAASKPAPQQAGRRFSLAIAFQFCHTRQQYLAVRQGFVVC